MADTNLSRRSLLKHMPVAALATSVALPAVPTGDPIFAAIDKHREAYASWLVACDAYYDKGCSETAKAEHEATILASREACDLLIQTPAVTIAGLLAVIAWLAEFDEGCEPDTCGAWLEAFAKSEAFANLKAEGGANV